MRSLCVLHVVLLLLWPPWWIFVASQIGRSILGVFSTPPSFPHVWVTTLKFQSCWNISVTPSDFNMSANLSSDLEFLSTTTQCVFLRSSCCSSLPCSSFYALLFSKMSLWRWSCYVPGLSLSWKRGLTLPLWTVSWSWHLPGPHLVDTTHSITQVGASSWPLGHSSHLPVV